MDQQVCVMPPAFLQNIHQDTNIKDYPLENVSQTSSNIMAATSRETQINHSIEGKMFRKRSLSPPFHKHADRLNFKASKHSAFKKVESTMGRCTENNQVSHSLGKHKYQSSPTTTADVCHKLGLEQKHKFSVAHLLKDDFKRGQLSPDMTPCPLDISRSLADNMTLRRQNFVTAVPNMTPYPDPRIPFTSYWLKHISNIQDGRVPPYMPMFSPFLLNPATFDPIRSYMSVPPSLFHHVNTIPPQDPLPADLRTHMRRSTGSSSTETSANARLDQSILGNASSSEKISINEESFGFSRQETRDCESDSDREQNSAKHELRESSSPSERRRDDISMAKTSPKISALSPIHVSPILPEPNPLSFLTQRRLESQLSYPGATHSSILPPGMMGFPAITRRPRDPTKPPPLKKYKCDICAKAFSRSNTLVTHRRIHTGEKPFSCEICSRAFRQPGNLTRHRLTHTTVKPYVCPVCRKAFNRASNLHTHMRTHANFKPFSCQLCRKGFEQNVDLKIHMYTHAGRGKTPGGLGASI